MAVASEWEDVTPQSSNSDWEEVKTTPEWEDVTDSPMQDMVKKSFGVVKKAMKPAVEQLSDMAHGGTSAHETPEVSAMDALKNTFQTTTGAMAGDPNAMLAPEMRSKEAGEVVGHGIGNYLLENTQRMYMDAQRQRGNLNPSTPVVIPAIAATLGDMAGSNAVPTPSQVAAIGAGELLGKPLDMALAKTKFCKFLSKDVEDVLGWTKKATIPAKQPETPISGTKVPKPQDVPVAEPNPEVEASLKAQNAQEKATETPHEAARPFKDTKTTVKPSAIGPHFDMAMSAVKNLFMQDTLPKLSEAGGTDVFTKAVEHAVSRTSTPRIIADFKSKVFPEHYTNTPENIAFRSKVMDIVNKDNILAGFDSFIERARKAGEVGDPALAARYAKRAEDITRVHDLQAYEKEVVAAKNDAAVVSSIENIRKHVNPLLDDMYLKMKAADPEMELTGRGRYFDTRVNLLPSEREKLWQKYTSDTEKGIEAGDMPEPSLSSYRNPDVKKDMYDRQAHFTADSYSTDFDNILTNVLAPRYGETTKLDFYKSMIDSGIAIEVPRGKTPPPDIQGVKAQRMPVMLPHTDTEGVTHRFEHNIYVRGDVAGEIKNILGLDRRTPQHALLRGLVDFQLLSPTDATVHIKNLLTVLQSVQGAGGVATDLLRTIPGVNSIDGLARIGRQLKDLIADSPETRAEIADMAKQGMIRPMYRHTSSKALGALNVTQDAIHRIDTSVRVLLNRHYSNLVKQGLAPNDFMARYKFVQQVGEYNSRLMPFYARVLRDTGISPFVVAGRNFNKTGLMRAIGMSGIPGGGMRVRSIAIAGAVMPIATTMMLNTATTGNPMGGKDTPFGYWNTGKVGKDGKTLMIDVLGVTGIRRGYRAIGLNAALEGIRTGKNANQIGGKALEEMANTWIHPFTGPAANAISTTGFGKKLQIGARMTAKKVPEGGAIQYLENAKQAGSELNPAVAQSLRFIHSTIGSLITGKEGPDAEEIGKIAKTAYDNSIGSALGIRRVGKSRNNVEEDAHNMAMAKLAEGGITDEQKQRYELREQLRRGRQEPGGIDAINKAYRKGEITKLDRSNALNRKNDTELARSLSHLDAVQVGKLYLEAKDPDEKKKLYVEFNGKFHRTYQGQDKPTRIKMKAMQELIKEEHDKSSTEK